jgi:hypothetical protein
MFNNGLSSDTWITMGSAAHVEVEMGAGGDVYLKLSDSRSSMLTLAADREGLTMLSETIADATAELDREEALEDAKATDADATDTGRVPSPSLST